MTVATSQNAVDLLAQARQARASGDTATLSRLADALLAFAPREPRFLVLKADALTATGDHRSASTFYGAAVAQGRAMTSFPPDLTAELDHALSMQAKAATRFEDGLRAGLSMRGFDQNAPDVSRFAASLDLMTGRRKVYYQQPKFYLFQGLPQVEFQPRETVSGCPRSRLSQQRFRPNSTLF